jgi:hypothetical protein
MSLPPFHEARKDDDTEETQGGVDNRHIDIQRLLKNDCRYGKKDDDSIRCGIVGQEPIPQTGTFKETIQDSDKREKEKGFNDAYGHLCVLQKQVEAAFQGVL